MSAPYYELKETLLKAEGINLELGGKQILNDLSLEVKNISRPGMQQGQIVGLLGPSGMGKTQLFRILSGLNIPDSGHVHMGDGRPVTPGRVGVVAQSYPLLMHRTVLGNMMVAARQAGMGGSEAANKCKALLNQFNVGDCENKYPAQLSGGQRQRVAIAQQLICSEHLLLFDEPFSGLDPNALSAVCDFLLDSATLDETTTYIVVTHDIDSAVRICDTLWLLGRERDSAGKPIPGASIQHVINLIDCGLAWHRGIEKTPEFFAKVNEIKSLFEKL